MKKKKLKAKVALQNERIKSLEEALQQERDAHFKIQYQNECLTVSEMCRRMDLLAQMNETQKELICRAVNSLRNLREKINLHCYDCEWAGSDGSPIPCDHCVACEEGDHWEWRGWKEAYEPPR